LSEKWKVLAVELQVFVSAIYWVAALLATAALSETLQDIALIGLAGLMVLLSMTLFFYGGMSWLVLIHLGALGLIVMRMVTT